MTGLAIKFTMFPDLQGSKKSEFTRGWAVMAQGLRKLSPRKKKADLPLLKLATFGDALSPKGSARNDGNVVEVWGVEGDHDAGTCTPEEALARLKVAGIAGIVYTTPSHRPNAPRWRVLVPFSTAKPPAERERWAGILNAVLSNVLAPESFRLSQAFYAGPVEGVEYRVLETDGAPLDLAPGARVDPVFPPEASPSRLHTRKQPGGAATRETPGAVIAARDPAFVELQAQGVVRETDPLTGKAWISCPFEAEHTSPPAAFGTVYFPRGTGGYLRGHFKCMHAHCSGRSDGEFRAALGVTPFDDAGARPLPEELAPVPPFPLDALPDVLRGYVEGTAREMGCAADFVGASVLAGLSFLVSRVVDVRPTGRKAWTVSGNLWFLVVGRPGTMKTAALSAGLAPVQALEDAAAAEHSVATGRHKQACAVAALRRKSADAVAKRLLEKNPAGDLDSLVAGTEDPPPPARVRYVVRDVTYEALGAIIHENPQGVLCVRDELKSLLSGLAREENAAARGFFLEAWSGGAYTFDRVGRGSLHMERAKLTLIGNTQPEPMATMLREASSGTRDDGMLQRFLIVWPDSPGAWRHKPAGLDPELEVAARAVYSRLAELTPEACGAEQQRGSDGKPEGLPYLTFSEEAQALFIPWAEALAAHGARESEALEAALSKFRKSVPALALLLHLAEVGHGPVGAVAVARALKLAEYFAAQARRAFGGADSAAVAAAHRVLQRLDAGELRDPFTSRDIYRKGWAELRDRATVEAALATLVARGHLSEEEQKTAGRPSTVYRRCPTG